MDFNEQEIKDILISIISLSIIGSLQSLFNGNSWIGSVFSYIIIVSISLLTKLIVHKKVAQKYDCNATYKFNYYLFIISLLIGFVTNGNIIFAALGSIIISSALYTRLGHKFVNISRRESGIIALSGPMANIVLALISLLLNPINSSFFQSFFFLNCFMALFSLIPIPPIEGHLILWWNRLVWITIILIPLFLLFFGFSALFALFGIILLIILTFILWEKMF